MVVVIHYTKIPMFNKKGLTKEFKLIILNKIFHLVYGDQESVVGEKFCGFRGFWSTQLALKIVSYSIIQCSAFAIHETDKFTIPRKF